MALKLHIHTLNRRVDTPEPTDEELGAELVKMVREAADKRGAAPVALAFRGPRLDLAPLRAVADAGLKMGRFMGGWSRSELDSVGTPELIGVMGIFKVRGSDGGPPVPVATVFLEWPDCRWWQWRALIDLDDGGVLEETETFGRAVDGLARPGGLGGWWSLGRRQGLSMNLRREPSDESPEEPPDAPPPMVH